jgi:hypothetical protein
MQIYNHGLPFLEFRGLIPIVETSSHENINVDNAFFLGKLTNHLL